MNPQVETIIENKDGLFFDEITIESITNKFIEFDKKIDEGFFNRKEISERSQKFNEKYFIRNLSDFIQEKWNNFSDKNN